MLALLDPGRPLSRPRELVALLVGSRLAIWVVGMVAFAAFKASAEPNAFLLDPTGEVLAASFYRRDSPIYAEIALQGYGGVPLGFFPLYPLLMKGIEAVIGSVVVAGLLISLPAFAIAIALLHRLAELELGAAAARRTTYFVVLFPTTVFLTAVYTEALFLALSVGCLLAARQGRWALAGLLAALASGTRNTGCLLAVALFLLYLYGPRSDRSEDAPPRGWRPRYRLRASAAWIALAPLGAVAYSLYTAAEHDDPFAWISSHDVFGVERHPPLSALFDGTKRGLESAIEFVIGGDESRFELLSHVIALGFLVFAVVAVFGALRRLPPAYGVYALLALVPPLSAYPPGHPLSSFSRYLVVLFPLQMWLASWANTRRRFALVLMAWSVGAVGITAAFALGRFG
jgi:hypothetical protein